MKSLYVCDVAEAGGLKLSFNWQNRTCGPKPTKNGNSYDSIKTEYPGGCVGS